MIRRLLSQWLPALVCAGSVLVGAISWHGGYAHPGVAVVEDEFCGSLSTDGNIGAQGWSLIANGTEGTLTLTGSQGHPCTLQFTSGATSGNDETLLWTTTATTDRVRFDDVASFDFIVRTTSAVTNLELRAGLGEDCDGTTNGAELGTDGVWFEYDSAADASWRYLTRTGGTSATAVDSTVDAAQNTWFWLHAERRESNSWDFWVNGAAKGTQTTQLPTSVMANACFFMETTTGSAKTGEIDYFQLRTYRLAR